MGSTVTTMRRSLLVALGIIALVPAIGLVCFGAIFVLAGLSDAIGSRLAALAILLLVAVATAAIVLAAHRSQVPTSTISKRQLLSDWAWSLTMVLGGLFLSLLPSFSIAFLLVSLAEHQLLPAAFGGALLEVRGASGGMSIVGAIWFTFQLSWIIPMAVRIHRDGMGRAIDAFRLAGLMGVYVSIPLSGMALVVLFLLGPPP